MAVRGIQTTIDRETITITVAPPPPELAASMEVINETGEIVMAGLAPLPGNAMFLMVLPDGAYPDFSECFEAAYIITEACDLDPRHAEHISLLLGVVCHDPQNRTVQYNIADGPAIATFASNLIARETLGARNPETIREGILDYILSQLQQASENPNGLQAGLQIQEQDDAQIRGERQDQIQITGGGIGKEAEGDRRAAG